MIRPYIPVFIQDAVQHTWTMTERNETQGNEHDIPDKPNDRRRGEQSEIWRKKLL